MSPAALDDLQRRRLRWRARRGLLENDVILTRFLDRYERGMDAEQVRALAVLFDQPDNDLLDLLLARTEPTGEINTPPVRAVLAMMRTI